MSHTLQKSNFFNEQTAVTEMAVLHETLSQSLRIFQYNALLM